MEIKQYLLRIPFLFAFIIKQHSVFVEEAHGKLFSCQRTEHEISSACTEIRRFEYMFLVLDNARVIFVGIEIEINLTIQVLIVRYVLRRYRFTEYTSMLTL